MADPEPCAARLWGNVFLAMLVATLLALAQFIWSGGSLLATVLTYMIGGNAIFLGLILLAINRPGRRRG